MPKTLNPQNTFPTNIPNFPISGNNEPIAIEPLENAIQAVLNRSENLHVRLSEAETQGVKRVRTVASLAALSAATGFNNGDVCDVEGYGRYRLYNPSGLTADGLWVLNAAGGGRWVHTLRDMRGIGNGLATLDSSQRLAQDVRDASILTQHIANQAVTAAKLAPGSVAGHLGYTPLNKAGDTMTGLLTVAPNIGQVLNLKGGSADHVYLGFYARSANQTARSGYIGYDAAGTSDLNIRNEIPGGRVLIQGSEVPIERGFIDFNSDWNSYTTPGYYQVRDAGSSAANTPPASYSYGILLVIKTGTAITQLYTQHIGSGTFVRQVYDGGWGQWVELSPNFANRFVVQAYTPNITVLANDIRVIASNRVSLPSGKSLYLRRVRWSIFGTLLRPRIASTLSTWTGSNYYGEIEINQQLSNSSLAYVELVIVNSSGSNNDTGYGAGIWAELEIR